MVTCEFCNRSFKRRDNLLRHKRTVHADDFYSTEEDSEMSDFTEEPETNDSDHDSLSESEHTSDDEEDPWNEIVSKAFEDCQSQYEDKVKDLIDSEDMDHKTARSKAYKEMRPVYRKALKHSFIGKVLWYNLIKRDPTFRAIQSTALRSKEDEDFGTEEAWKYSVSKRKYLFDDILKQYIPPLVEDMDSDNEENQDDESSSNDNGDSNIVEM